MSCWVTCATGYMCHEHKPLKQHVSVIHLPARVKARLTVNYYQHTDTNATRAKALARLVGHGFASDKAPLGLPVRRW